MDAVPALGRNDSQTGECVVSIGVFDGVHQGHLRVLKTLRAAAARHALPTVVLTFHPHPRLVLQPHKPLPMLVSLPRRLALLAETGHVDRCIILPFDEHRRAQSADDFVRETLVERLGMRALVVGENFTCGRGRVGSVDYLRTLGVRFGFTVYAVAMARPDGDTSSVPSSSTETRRLIQAGQVARAAVLLRRPHELECTVLGGLAHGGGHELTLPTGMCIPAPGTYTAVSTGIDGRSKLVSVDLTWNEEISGFRCLLRPIEGGLPTKPEPRPGTPVVIRFLDALHSGIASKAEPLVTT